jgi:hypothetical protein
MMKSLKKKSLKKKGMVDQEDEDVDESEESLQVEVH